MCGIVGYLGRRQAAPVLLEGLKRLEYRGYDSAGLGVLSPNGKLEIVREVGKIARLENKIKRRPIQGFVGLAHSRWATHGQPSEDNAHPHTDCDGGIVLVHNGIIENYHALKEKLISRGHKFRSQTDTEVLAHLFEDEMASSKSRFKKPEDIFSIASKVLSRVQGAYAVVVLAKAWGSRLLGIRKDCPLVIGVGDEEAFLASDVPALLPFTRNVIFVEDNELVLIEPGGKVHLRKTNGRKVSRRPALVSWDPMMAEKGGFKHFMLKEIHEAPRAFEDTLKTRAYEENLDSLLDESNLSRDDVRAMKRVKILACGTAYHAGMVGEYLFERFARIPCDAEIASELRYKNRPPEADALTLAISQSGETADTLAALRLLKSARGSKTVGIVNQIGSTMTREVGGTIYTRCGPEIGVASTKAFVAQLAVLYLLSLAFGRVRGFVEKEELERLTGELLETPSQIRQVINRLDASIAETAKEFQETRSFLYLGRHVMYPIALEGALKLKEISYIHAEGYAAGEMKHGPIALIDRDTPLFAFAPKSSPVYAKMVSNLEEAAARGGKIVAVVSEGDHQIKRLCHKTLEIPSSNEWFDPVLAVVCAQLFAYHVANLKGLDVDQPRNLAKSVTVE